MTVKAALKALCKTITGQDAAGKTIDQILTSFNTKAAGGSVAACDTTITDGGTKPVTGGAIYTALAGKQAALPTYGVEQYGKVLGVDETGALAWVDQTSASAGTT